MNCSNITFLFCLISSLVSAISTVSAEPSRILLIPVSSFIETKGITKVDVYFVNETTASVRFPLKSHTQYPTSCRIHLESDCLAQVQTRNLAHRIFRSLFHREALRKKGSRFQSMQNKGILYLYSSNSAFITRSEPILCFCFVEKAPDDFVTAGRTRGEGAHRRSAGIVSIRRLRCTHLHPTGASLNKWSRSQPANISRNRLTVRRVRNEKTFRWHVLIMVAAVLWTATGRISAGGQISLSGAGAQNADIMFDYLLPVVYASGNPVRLYYRGACPSTGSGDPVPFPMLKLQPPSKSKVGLDAIRQIFQRDRNVTVREGLTGIIRIWIGKVPAAILETKISRLDLNRDPADRYNPDGILQAIMATKEMNAAGDTLGFIRPTTLGYSGVVPDDRLPHFPATLRNMTAEQILDKMAKTWARRIVVMYGVCAKPAEPGGGRQYTLNWLGQITWPGDVEGRNPGSKP